MADSRREMFRKEALTGQSGLDVQNELPIYQRPQLGLPLWILGICVILVCVWALLGRINENVYGSGIITQYSHFSSIVSPSNGFLVSLDVQVGDEVSRGQLVGRIFSKDDFEDFLIATRLLEYHQKVMESIRAHIKKLENSQKDFTAEKMERLNASLKRMEEQLQWYRGFVDEKARNLSKAGAISTLKFMEMREENSRRINEYDSTLSEKINTQINLSKSLLELENQLFEYELTVRRARFDAEQKWRNLLSRSRIISYSSGVVSDVYNTSGDMVSQGQDLIRLVDTRDSGSSAWSVSCFLPVSDARKIRVGMQATVTPSTVKAEQDGSIYGIVTSVDRTMETKETLMAFFKNASYCDYILKSCKMVPVTVTIALSCNRNNPSGFNWTSGRGPDIRLAPTTMCSVKVTTSYASPIELLLGKIRRYVTGAGLLEEKIAVPTMDKEQ